MDEQQKPTSEDLRESWIESLLQSVSQSQEHEERITRVMKQIESESNGISAVRSVETRTRLIRWGSMGVAVAALLVLFLVTQNDGTSSAIAAIQRSLDVAEQRTTRKYLLQIETHRAIVGTRTNDVDLYVNGTNRFVLRRSGPLPQTSIWLGQDGSESWIVPPLGPVLKGDRTFLSHWIRSHKELDTPYLHISTVLTRMMSRGYRLEELPDEKLKIRSGLTVECQHIRAKRETADLDDLPLFIELWMSRESGMAVKLIAQWQLEEGEFGRKSVRLTFQSEEPALSDKWFTAEGHYQGHLPVIYMDSSDD